MNISIERGETFGIVGESGSGKSTVARLVLRLVEPTGGRREFPRPRSDAPRRREELRRERRHMQMIFQDPYGSLNSRMTVGDTLAEPLRSAWHRPAADRAARIEALAATRSACPLARSARYPHEFSGGQRQRIAIARALATRTRIRSSPTSRSRALDVSIQAQVLNLLARSQRTARGLTMLFISHDLRVIEFLCDQIAVMYLGEIVETAARARRSTPRRSTPIRRLFSPPRRARPRASG